MKETASSSPDGRIRLSIHWEQPTKPMGSKTQWPYGPLHGRCARTIGSWSTRPSDDLSSNPFLEVSFPRPPPRLRDYGTAASLQQIWREISPTLSSYKVRIS